MVFEIDVGCTCIEGNVPRRFSEIYSLGLDQPQLDFVDITPEADTPLFIDPFAISIKEDEWSQRCNQHIVHFFETALGYVRAGNDSAAKQLLNGLSEPNETCLGLSRGQPAGRGVSGQQALDLYESLAHSQAAQSGLLEELAECDLFVEGIGRDKISDITTNIIRRLLIEYTQAQCDLHKITLSGNYPTGRFWDIDARQWRSEYAPLPVVGGKRIILVPKYSVRRALALNAQEYYSHHIVNFIQAEEFERGSSLVRVLRNGERRPPYKKVIKERFPFSKDFIARFSESNPNVLASYKSLYSNIEGAKGTLSHDAFDETFDEVAFATALIAELRQVPPGNDSASAFHKLMVGTLEFIFWPHLIYPQKEAEIDQGRKRIDIAYTNAALTGFFYRAHTAHDIASKMIMVECKNYSKDPANQEIDQIQGRFSINRGKLGLLVFRDVSNYELLIARCRDTVQAGRGYIIPLGDSQVIEYLELISQNRRSEIDASLERILMRLIS
ncbi:MAG: hypothetical protein KJ017_03850 [Alphaproteobacteria bacterium]|nr:hypothetical protein [Alphaproteobacteria bacterium]